MSPAARVVVVLFAGVFHVAAGTVPWNLPVLAEDAPVEQRGCSAVLDEYYKYQPTGKPPPREMPEQLVDGYTWNGRIPIGDFFVDDTNGGRGSEYGAPNDYIEQMIASASSLLASDTALARHRRLPDIGIVRALRLLDVKDKHVVVFGSMDPWYESLVLAAGAADVVTVEYNRLSYDHPRITTVTPGTLPAVVPADGFDLALSISGFDHDGLGRYGDPMRPNGDLSAMAVARCLLKPGSGVMVLTVPIGPDVVVYNLHRRYGPLRLPSLLHGWTVENILGWDSGKLEQAADFRRSYEPAFVLRAPPGGDMDGGVHTPHGEL